MSWTNETKIAFTIFLCAALIGTAVMIRESGITGLATKENANLPPKWVGKTNKYVVEQNSPLMLNLAELFSDPEGQVLAFVATETKDLSIALDGNQLTIVPEQGFVGERIVTVYASDGEKIAHKKIKVEVGGLQSLSEGIQPDNESESIPESEPTSQPEQQSSPDAGIQDGGSIAVTCTSCGDCTACAASPGNTCVLTTGISSSTTCITIGNDNVKINCDGKTITFNTGGGGNDYGITSDSHRNLTIANCTVISASASISAVPINLYRTNSSLIINNTIKALSTNGIDVRSSFYNVITSNKVNATNPNGNAGIKLRQTSAHNNVTSNIVLTNGSAGGNVGILADFESPNNTIANNFVVTGGSSTSNYGINAEVGDTKIVNNSINTTGESVNHGILLNGGTNSIVANNSILATGISLAQSGIYVINTMQNVFINNNIRTIGSTKNHGIYVDAGAHRNVFLQNTISGNGTDTFAIYVESGVSGSNFSSTVINNTPHWIYTGAGTSSNFSNTTFMMPDGSINILPLIQLNSSQNISKERLNISTNKLFLNSTYLTYFNTSAIITLYGLSYSDPKPVVDYEDDGSYVDCLPSQCSELSYSGGVFVFNTTHFTGYSADETGPSGITGCPVTINTSTTLTQDLVSNDTCITIGNDSVVLDCAGYSISYNAKGSDYKYGIVAVNQNNITVKDCFIRDINASGMAGYGINFTGVNNSIVTNSIILTNGTQFSVGIFLQDSNNNTIANSTINATDSSHNWAIGLISSQNTTIIGNNLVSHGTDANNHGISITGFSHGPIISYNNISISGTSNNWGIFMQYANYAIVSNNTISTNCTTSSNNGLLIQYSNWGNFSSNYISAYGSDKENCGIFTYVSNTLSLYNNYISSNGGTNNYGIYAYSGENNTFAFNTINTNGTGFSHGILMNYTKRFNIFSNNIRTNDASSYGIFMTYSNSTLLNNTVLNDTVHWLFFDKNTFSNLTNTTFQTPLGSINVIQFMQINGSEDITKAKLNITYNKAFLNSSNLTYFNTSAIITLYGLSYSDPKPVVDYEDDGSYADCPASQCSELSYSGGTFVFNTTHFTSYSAEESGGGTCGTCLECSSCTSTPGASCAVSADLATSGTCITINASNVVLDCQGHTIVFDKWGMGKASGVMSKDVQNVTVKNCNIITNHSNGNEDFGINFTNSSGFRIINNSIFVNTTSNNRGISIGMYGVGDSCDGLIENNTVVSLGTGSSNVGLFLASACNSNITGNKITANGTFTSYGISLGSSIGLLFSHNNISVIGDISSYAIAISDCLFSVFNATLLNDSSNWIVCGGMSMDNNFTNTTFATRHGSINILPEFNLTENIYVAQENLNVSNNRAFLNSTALPFLNVSGIVTLENITYSNPRPLVDWNDDYSYEPCPVDVCSELEHTGSRYVFNVTHFTGYSSDETGTSCPLTIYQSTTLSNDLSSLTSCITFGNDSIYLDCDGHTIYYNNGSGSDDKGIIAIGRENITIRNCIIKDPTSGGMNNYAVYLEKVNSSVVVNNTMYSNCTTSCNGIVLRNSSEGNVVANNTIITLNQVGYNVEVDNSSTNAIVGNTMIANSSGNMQVGIRLRDSHSSNISHNNISISGNSNNICIELRNAENNRIENNTISNYGGGDNNQGMLLWENSSNNSVVENAIRSSSTGNAIMIDRAGANVFIANWLRGGSSGYALWIEGSSFSSFHKTIINESTHFIYVNNTEHNNFTNTTFDNVIARVNFPWLLQFNGSQNVSASKLQLGPNRVFLNSTNLSFMNTTAIITFNEIAFIDPEPVVDYDDDGSYVPCPADVCTELGYTDNIYVFNVTGFTSYKVMETAQINITSCPVVINSSAILKNDVSSSGSCITINASNAFLDCQGYLINYNSGGGNNNYGIGSFGNNNVTVRNCRIFDSTTSGNYGYGVYYNSTNQSFVINNSVWSNGSTDNYCVYLFGATNDTIANNTLRPRSSTGEIGLVAEYSKGAIVSGNVIATYFLGNENNGIVIRQSNNTAVFNNSITTDGDSLNYALRLSYSNNITVDNNTIVTDGELSGNYGLYVGYSNDNRISGNRISTVSSTTNNNGIQVSYSLLNVFRHNNISVTNGSYCAYLSNSNSSAFENTAFNGTGAWIYSSNAVNNTFENTTFHTSSGSINLPYVFNLSSSADVTRERLLVSNNKAFVNSTALPFIMNVTGIVTLYSVVKENPEPTVDWYDIGYYVRCPADVCTELGYTDGTYIFNVSHFTSYSTTEAGIVNITGCPITINSSARLAQDISFTSPTSDCITLNADNITLDCEGRSITRSTTGSDTSAIYAVGYTNVTVKNCNIKHINSNDAGYFYGIYFFGTSSSAILNNTVIIDNKVNSVFNSVDSGAVYVIGNNNIVGNNTVSCNSSVTLPLTSGTLYCLQTHGRRNNVSNNEISANAGTSIALDSIAVYAAASSFVDSNNTFANNRIRAIGTTAGINNGMFVEAIDTKLYNNTFSGSPASMLKLENKVIANVTTINSTSGAWIYSTSASQFENTTFLMASGSINILPLVSIPAGSRVLNKSHLNISNNKAFLNSVSRNEWNASGIITLYGITAVSPAPIVDYEDDGSYVNCPADVCTRLDYSGAAYKFNVSHFTSFSTKDTVISSCPVTINESTTLSGNLSSNTSCITIGANNVVLDCNGSTITFGISSTPQSAGIKADTRINVTIGNCTIILGNSSAEFAQGININAGGNITIINNIIQVNGKRNNTGIHLFYPDYDKIRYNTVTVHGSQEGNYGIRFYSSYYNNITGNNVSVNGTTNNVAIYLAAFSYGNVSANNATAKGTLGNNYGMHLTGVSNGNTIERNKVIVYGDANSDYGIRLYVSVNHNNITGNTILTGGPGSDQHGVVLQDVNNNRLLFNNITTTGPNSYGAYIQSGNNNRFNKSKFNTTQWVYSDFLSTTYFENTTFVRSHGSILLQKFTLVGTYNISEAVINVTNNRAFVNTGKYSSLNSSAIVSLNNISYLDPSPLVDWNDDGIYEYCPANKCAELGYSEGVFTYNVTHFTSYSSSESASIITGCPVSINESSWLANDVSTTSGCIIFNANNIELECGGNAITYNTDGVGSDAGISASGKRNITVRNCRIVLGNQEASNSPAIYAAYTNNSLFVDNTILIDGKENNRGILLENMSNYNRVLQNRISTRGNYSHGIFEYLSTNNTIQGNVVSTSGITENSGIYLTHSWSNAVYDNNVTTNGTDVYNHGIILDYYAQNNSIERNDVELFGDGGSNYGIYLVTSSSNNNITANNIRAHASLIGNNPLVIQSDSINNRFSFNNMTGSDEAVYAVYVQLSSGQSFNNTLINNTRAWCYFDDASPSSFTNTTFETSSGSINLFVFNVSDGVGLDLTDAVMNIMPNKAFLNSSAFEDLNRSGIVTLYSIVYIKPKPLVDFEDDGSYVDCPESICTELSHSGSTYSYAVTHFTSYSSFEELPITLSKSDSPDPVTSSGLLNYTISIYANRTAANVTLTDIYPLQVVYVSSQPVPVSGTNNTWIVGNLTAGENRTINITVRVLEILNNTIINNTANVTLQNATGGWDNASVEEATTVINYRIINSNITNSTITNCTIINSTVIDSTKQDCVIINSVIIGSNNINSTIIDSNETNSTDNNTYVSESYLYGAVKTDSRINATNITNSNVTNVTLTYCVVENSTLYNVVNSSCNYANVRQEPPVPPPQPYQPQGGSAGKGYEIPRWPPPAPLPGQACVENWACEEWSRCEGGKQRRVCVDLNNCNITKYVPLTERACGLEQIQELPAEEQPEILRPEKPVMPLPELVAGVTVVLPVVIDTLLVVLALIAVISLIIGSEKRSNIMLRVITVLLMLAGFAGIVRNYIAGEGLLLFQVISLLVIVVVLVIVWLVDYRKSGRKAVLETAPSPGLPEGVEHIEEVTLPEPAVQSMPAGVRVEEKPSKVIEQEKPREMKIYVTHPEPKQQRVEKGVSFKPVLPEKSEERKVYVTHAEPRQKRIAREKPARAYRPVLEKVAELKPEGPGPMDIESVLRRSKKTLRKVHKTLKRMKKRK